jgi:hypothetical protein
MWRELGSLPVDDASRPLRVELAELRISRLRIADRQRRAARAIDRRSRHRAAAVAQSPGELTVAASAPLFMWINVGTLVLGALADGSSSQEV